MNNDQEIILAKISAVYDKPPFVKMETGQMEMILKCVGLGAYTKYYLRFWLSSCRASLAVSALRIVRYCPCNLPAGWSSVRGSGKRHPWAGAGG